MKNYLVIGMNKITSGEAFKNALGHNRRDRNYESKNVRKEDSHKNIVLENLEFRTKEQYLKHTREKLSSGKRQIKEDSAAAFEIVIDSSKDALTEEQNIQYLKDSHEYFKKRFRGQEILNSTIHMDEGKPHLHMVFSYFNEELGQWNQKNMYKNGITDINNILKDFEKNIGKKYNLVKGDNLSHLNEELQIKSKQIEVVVKKGFIKDETKVINHYNNKEVMELQKKLNKSEMEKEDLKRRILKIGNYKEVNKLINENTYNKDREKALTTKPAFLNLPSEKTENGYLIHSPLRFDKNKSFKVFFDEKKSVWLSHDYALDETYNNIDLYMKLFNTDYKETILEINKINEVYRELPVITEEEDIKKSQERIEKTEHIRKSDITNRLLKSYLEDRYIEKIPNNVFQISIEKNGITNEYISMKNESSGYVCRNKDMKRNSGKADLTIINNNQKNTIITEGMFDYLSYYQTHENNVNYIVLNSVNNLNPVRLEKAKNVIENKDITICLDNDDAGKIATKKLKTILENEKEKYNCKSHSILDFGNFKDYAEYYEKINKIKFAQKELQRMKEEEDKQKERDRDRTSFKDKNIRTR